MAAATTAEPATSESGSRNDRLAATGAVVLVPVPPLLPRSRSKWNGVTGELASESGLDGTGEESADRSWLRGNSGAVDPRTWRWRGRVGSVAPPATIHPILHLH